MSQAKPCVMTVDDDPLILRYLRIALDRAGYEAIIVEDPQHAVDQVKKTPPDLILLDVRLSSMNGFDLYDQIRRVSEAPVIFLSASNHAEERRRALEMGAKEFVVKPFTPASLLIAIQTALNDQWEADGSGA